MLQHEQELPLGTPTTEIPAAQIRVTSEELAQAINALEASKDESARTLAGTVPIGEVVRELRLEATPEEVWAQVQKQRARKAADEAAAESAARAAATQKEQATAAQSVAAAQAAAAQAIAAARSAAQSAQVGAQVYARPRRRGRWLTPLGIGLLIYAGVHGSGIGLLIYAGVHGSQVRVHTPTNAPGVIAGYNQRLTRATEGKDVEVVGGKGTLTLQGDCPTLMITGDDNHIRLEGTVGRIIATGDNNSVAFTQGSEPPLIGTGVGNHISRDTP